MIIAVFPKTDSQTVESVLGTDIIALAPREFSVCKVNPSASTIRPNIYRGNFL